MKRLRLRQGGFALVPCALLLTVVLLALSASLRAARQQLDAALAQSDLQRARLSADSSLTEAEHQLRSVFVASPDPGEARLPEEQLAQACTRAYSELSGYQMDLLRSDERTGVCRITAIRAGRSAGTHVRLQAEFALRACQPPTEPVEAVPLSEAAASSVAPPASCAGEVRLLSWRTLNEV